MWTRQSAIELALGLFGMAVGATLLSQATAFAALRQMPTTDALDGDTNSVAPVEAAPPSVETPKPQSDALDVASYDLSVRLDPVAHALHGSGKIRWRNTSKEPASDLYFHLYLNAFKNSETLFQRSSFDRGRSGQRTKQPGQIDVRKLVAAELGGEDLWLKAEKHSPDDPKDETDIRVPLPEPVEPGHELTLEVEWDAKLPQISERTGYADDFHMVGQWFPKLARRESDGSWAHFPFHPQSEFYADYGSYDVTIDVPENVVVGATGELMAETRALDRSRVRYHASNVHDFAWTAWARFEERNEIIDGTRVRLLYPPDHATLVEREFNAIRYALPHFNRAYGRYPYPVLTVVHPPANAREAGGMEYPTLITTGGGWLHNLFAREIETVTVHELGHQWFYGLLGSNEHASPFLDEGINSYAESVATRNLFGTASGGKLWDLEVSADAFQRMIAASRGQDDAVGAAADELADFASLGALIYARTATILQTLARVYGEDTFATALGEYSRKYRFRHPTAADFLAEIGKGLGPDAQANLQTLLFERGWVDYAVTRVGSSPATTTDDSATSSAKAWRGQVLVYRRGTVSFPVDVDLIAADGSRTRQHWDGRGNWIKLNYEGKSPLVAAIVDPDSRIPIDSNLLNNGFCPKGASIARSLERTLYFAELLLTVAGP